MNLERTLAAAPDPILANTAWERVCERSEAREVLERPAVAEIAIPVLGFSPAAADFLVRHPDEAGLFATATPRTRANLDAEVANDVELLGAAAGLRRFRRRALLRIASVVPRSTRSSTRSPMSPTRAGRRRAPSRPEQRCSL
jgi:glutamine synthetase adenylyltransferase